MPESTQESQLRPLKIVGQLFAARFDEDGTVVWDGPIANLEIYPPKFGDALSDLAKETIAQFEEIKAIQAREMTSAAEAE